MSFFSDESVKIDLLRKYAKNRWAALPEDVIPLTAADPDFQAAPEIREAIRRIADEGTFSYGCEGGNPEFRETIAETVRERKGIECTPDNIYVTNGVAQAMMLTAEACCKPGDEVVLFDPVDFLFGQAVDRAGARRVYSRIDMETWSFDVDGLNDLVSGKTRMICICNPHNPLGRVMTREELKSVTDIAVDHNLVIMSDEIWSDIVYDGRKHVATATISEEVADRTISLYGFSKTFAMAGLQIGFMVIPNPHLMETIQKTVPGYFFPVNNVSQEAGRAAYEKAWYWAEDFVKHLQQIRDYSWRRLNSFNGLKCHKPEGTYTLFPDISSFGLTSEEMSKYLLDEARVAVVPGHGERFSYFGAGGEGHIRLVFSTSKKIMSDALDRIDESLGKLL